MSEILVVNEIYLSLQGESTFAGLPCVFVRLTACNLRCSYCDTAYAFTEGRKMTVGEVISETKRLSEPYRHDRSSQVANCELQADPTHNLQPATCSAGTRHGLPLIELTGGEPLLQKNSLPLMKRLCDEGFTVLLETSGALDISLVDPRVRRIMDLKCPSSGEVERTRWENLQHLKKTDEIKFVIGTVEDYQWAKRVVAERELSAVCPLLFSWVSPLQPHQQDKSLKKAPQGQTLLSRRELVERIVADKLPVRFQLQMHKFIWPPDERGV